MGLSFYNLSHRFGYQSPNWPYFEDVKIERIHYMAKSGVLSQRITTSMHNTTHIDAPAHVVQGTPFIDEVPLPHFFGSGIVVSIPKKKWEQITYDDLEKAAGKIVRPRDVVIVNTGWHKLYEDSEDYFCRAPGFVPSAGEWIVEKKVKDVDRDIDKVTGRRCTFAFFPWNWDRGDGCIIRPVAMIDPKGSYRIEKGEKV